MAQLDGSILYVTATERDALAAAGASSAPQGDVRASQRFCQAARDLLPPAQLRALFGQDLHLVVDARRASLLISEE